MPKQENWLDNIEVRVSDGLYVYSADMICEGCGVKLIRKLETKGIEDTGDSDDFPQGPTYGENESDTPSHCGNAEVCVNALKIPGGKKVGCPIKTYLTEDGVAYTREAILRDILQEDDHPRRVGRLWFELYANSMPEARLERLTDHEIPPRLWKAVSGIPRHEQAIVWGETWTDLAHVYGGAQSPDSMILWRLVIDDLGDFKDLQLVHLPESEAAERSLEDMLTEAISADAWE